MSLTITQTNAQIGLDRTPSKLEMQSQGARLELHQKQAKINLHIDLPKVIIDQHECFASAGLKNPFELTAEFAQRGKQQALEYIGKTAEDGDRLRSIEKPGNPIPEFAVRDAYPVHEFGLDFIPKARPKIDVVGSVKTDPEPNSAGTNNGVEGNYIPGNVNYNYTPAQISIYMKQYQSIKFDFQPNKVDYSI